MLFFVSYMHIHVPFIIGSRSAQQITRYTGEYCVYSHVHELTYSMNCLNLHIGGKYVHRQRGKLYAAVDWTSVIRMYALQSSVMLLQMQFLSNYVGDYCHVDHMHMH